MSIKKKKVKLRRSLLHQPKALAQNPPNVDEFCVSDFVEHQQKAVEQSPGRRRKRKRSGMNRRRN